MRRGLAVARMARALSQHFAAAERVVEHVRPRDENAFLGHLHQHAPPIAHDLAEVAGDTRFDDRIVDIGYDAEPGIGAGREDMGVEALVFVAQLPVEHDRLPGGMRIIVPVGVQPDVEMDEAFLVGQPLMAAGFAPGARNLEFDRELGNFVTGELRNHRLGRAPATAFLELAHARPQRARRDLQPIAIAIAEIGLNPDGRGRQERHCRCASACSADATSLLSVGP